MMTIEKQMMEIYHGCKSREEYKEMTKFVGKTCPDRTDIYADKCLAYNIVNNRYTVPYLKILHYVFYQLNEEDYNRKVKIAFNEDIKEPYGLADKEYVTIKEIDEIVLDLLNRDLWNHRDFMVIMHKELYVTLPKIVPDRVSDMVCNIRQSIRELSGWYVTLIGDFAKRLLNLFGSDGYYSIVDMVEYLAAIEVVSNAVISVDEDLANRIEDGSYNVNICRNKEKSTVGKDHDFLRGILVSEFMDTLIIFSPDENELTELVNEVPEIKF